MSKSEKRKKTSRFLSKKIKIKTSNLKAIKNTSVN